MHAHLPLLNNQCLKYLEYFVFAYPTARIQANAPALMYDECLGDALRSVSGTIPIKLIRTRLAVDIVRTYMNVANNRQLTLDIVAFLLMSHCLLVAACPSLL